MDDDARQELHDLTVEMAKLRETIANLKEAMLGLVRRDEFTPVKLIVYGLVGCVMTSVMLALLLKVLPK